ncbi:MAG: beta-propeller domain-containing protein, partial [Candidatus Aenigmarchaeota archaeon]|nr:beta-propeller domain-containing protein [Candidatus Aenigmarchaeota archaeon]
MKEKLLISVVLILAILTFTISYFLFVFKPTPREEILVKFTSEEDFKGYLTEARELAPLFAGVAGAPATRTMAVMEEKAAEMAAPTLAPPVQPERISPTTVQVKGIDEPDLVKTDGLRIYFSPKIKFYPIVRRQLIEEIPPIYPTTKTKIIKAFPPEILSILSEINETGDLFLTTNTLLILADKIYCYDIIKPEAPTKKFTIELNGSIVGARLYDGKIYVVLKDWIDYYRPCPILPLTINGKSMLIPCQEIYHPIQLVPVDITYTALILNPETGNVENSISFVGSDLSVVYMSSQAIYITYTYYEDTFRIMLRFFDERCKDIILPHVIERLREIEGYKISTTSKMMEFNIEMEKWIRTLSEDERLRIENELRNRMEKYFEEMKRELVKTGIVKIGLENFVISATGDIAGMPLNQFSLDEYNNYLRIATTVGMDRETENDVYVLNKDLKVVGSVKGLGIEERIYSVRFIGDRGYVVTFREIDPFYVLDLADPTKPEVKGELKIPGYSSYLHPIEEHLILGIGKEGWKVKISLFDVSSAIEPKEVDKYTLDEYWSDVLETHHAFLLDKKHEIFFIPGGKGGYIFSYSNRSLKL